MIDLSGNPQGPFCDGISRRNFLSIGSLALGGLSMPELLRAQNATTSQASSPKGIIMIFLAGGPPHQDMFDLKPDAPSEIRGEFNPIDTNVDGIQICELFPRLSRMMDKFALIRSLYDCNGGHSPYQLFSGSPERRNPPPCVGSMLSKVIGPAQPSVPAFVGLSPKTSHRPWGHPGEAGWLGPRHAPFCPEQGSNTDDMVLSTAVDVSRLDSRKALLTSVDRLQRDLEVAGELSSMDTYNAMAFNVLTSSKLVEALDVERADPKLRERYGKGDRKPMSDGPFRLLDQFLIARRLVEAGVRCVTLAFSRWDWHGGNFTRGRQDFPMLDQGLSALVEDIHQRGLDRDISVVVWGEFGRTPRINRHGGRDHWPSANFALLAGGGMRTGQVIGATDKHAAYPVDRPVHPQEVLATLYHNMGIDLNATTVADHQGRPHYLLDDHRDPIAELV
jgi:hypothetical protein